MIVNAFKKNCVALDLEEHSQISSLFATNNITKITHVLFPEILNGRIGYGGYLEKRNVYERSPLFYSERYNQYRNIHLGVDVWMPALSPVYNPLQEATVHSKSIQGQDQNYGGTIVISGYWNQEYIHLLFGHLSHDSVNRIAVGQALELGENVGFLGKIEENGNWPPHVHIQAIRDMGDYMGDYPGVVCEAQIREFEKNCPNPMPLVFRKDME